jgi:transposase
MHVRISRSRRNGNTYEYAQLVESVRRPSDGMPVHRVIATLGTLSTLELDNLRAALSASRAKQRVVVASYARGASAPPPDVLSNLRYLDVAVPLELWREWKLSELLDELIPVGQADVAPATIISALVIQRLVDPGSKLFATEWFPRSALPELQGVAPASFNNTRLHRVLDALDGVGHELMAKLPRRYEEKEGAFASLFLDVTDTAFVGRGPSMAMRGKTKEGFVARKIGIVLLCNERGYPLRWQVVPGTAHDSKTMLETLQSVSGLRWVGEAPVVCDRAMGKTATIRAMSELRLRFLTALTSTEFMSYSTDRLPSQAVAELKPASADDKKVEARAAQLVVDGGMEKVEDNLFVLDLGKIERESEERTTKTTQAPTVADAMKRCRRMIELVADQQCSSFRGAARMLGLGISVAAKYLRLRHLPEDIQSEVLAGRAENCTLDDLLDLTRLDPAEQRRQFDQCATASRKRRHTARATATATSPTSRKLKVRVVAYFNPGRFVEMRHSASRELAEIDAFVVELNDRLARNRGRRSRASIDSEVDRKLRKHDLLDAFDVKVHEEKVGTRPQYRVELCLDPAQWAARRRYDGFTVLVGHPDLPHTAAELCRLYRAKDIVEKDFQVIKSVVEVRPIWHHSDAKVRAHVTLCMLALLLERTLRQRLRGLSTTGKALELLEPCRLNQFQAAEQVTYGLTRPTPEQRDLLKRLEMLKLVDDEEVGERIRPR